MAHQAKPVEGVMGGFEVSIPNCGETWWSAVRTWWSMVSIVCMSLNAVETFYLLYSAIICPTCTPCTPYTTCTTCTPYTPCTPYTLCTLHPQTEAPLAAAAPDYSSFGGEVQEMTGGMAHLSMARPSEEPECLKRWKVEQEEKLRMKDADEEEKKEELRKVAAKELADWYKQYEEQLEKTRLNNKEQEVVVSEMNGITPGQEWERVSSHCDFSAKAPGHTKDVSRMRSILLQLKQSPPTTRE